MLQGDSIRTLCLLVLQRKKHKSGESGFTLIESLIAVVIVGILLTAIAPMLALSVASRVQARRVDLATKAARTYIEGVRAGVIPPIQTTASYFTSDPTEIAAPSSLPSLPGVQINNDGSEFSVTNPLHMVIQPMRNRGTSTTDELAKRGYELAVRVYRADAFNGTSPYQLAGNPPYSNVNDAKTEDSRVFIGTVGAKHKPIVVIRANIFSNSSTLDDIAKP